MTHQPEESDVKNVGKRKFKSVGDQVDIFGRVPFPKNYVLTLDIKLILKL